MRLSVALKKSGLHYMKLSIIEHGCLRGTSQHGYLSFDEDIWEFPKKIIFNPNQNLPSPGKIPADTHPLGYQMKYFTHDLIFVCIYLYLCLNRR
jgi:hypothetical protein